jgi:hypothetical protein
MVAYLDARIRDEASHPDGRRIAYFMTHPLMSTQNRPYGREGSLFRERGIDPPEMLRSGSRSASPTTMSAPSTWSTSSPRSARSASRSRRRTLPTNRHVTFE